MEHLCWQADKEFQSTATTHICSQHFDTKDIVKTLCGLKKVVNGALPTIFNPQELPSGPSEREIRMISRKEKKIWGMKAIWSFPRKVPVCRLMSLWRITTIVFIVKKNKVSCLPTGKKKTNTVKKSVSVSYQTNIGQLEMEELVKNVARLKIENKVLQNKVNNKAAMNWRECFMDNVLKNDYSMKFYTGLPTLTFLMLIFNILKPFVEKLKHWNSNKGNKVNF